MPFATQLDTPLPDAGAHDALQSRAQGKFGGKLWLLIGISFLTALATGCGKEEELSTESTAAGIPAKPNVATESLPQGTVTTDENAALQSTGTGKAGDAAEKVPAFVSVKDFGAVGDGLTDDTDALIAFFTYLTDNEVKGMGVAGTFLVSDTIFWTVNGDFNFEAPKSFIIKASSSFPVDRKLVEPDQDLQGDYSFKWVGGTLDGRAMPARNAGAPDLLYITNRYINKRTLQGIYFLCNDDRTGTAGDSCLFMSGGEDFHISGCYFQGAIDSAIYISGNSAETYGRRVIITGNFFTECLNAVITKRQFQDHIVEGNIITDTTVSIIIGGPADRTKLPGFNAVISNNLLKNVGRGIEAQKADGTVISGNRIENFGLEPDGSAAGYAAIEISGSNYCAVTGNIITVTDGITRDPTSVGIAVRKYTQYGTDYFSLNNLITGNQINGAPVGLSTAIKCDANKFTGNYLRNYTTATKFSGAGSYSAYWNDEDAYIRSFGPSGQSRLNTSVAFVEHAENLLYELSVPNDKNVGWLISDGDANGIARIVYEHALDQWQIRAGSTTDTALFINEEGPQLRTYTVSNLPQPAHAGGLIYVSDGRKDGENAGNGTGVLCYFDGSNWISSDTSLAVKD